MDSEPPSSTPSEERPDLSGLGRELLGTQPGTQRSKPSGPWQPPTAEELQRLLPQYEITQMLGRGGMGAVYQGRQISLDRPVAIKILSAELDESDKGFAERFKNEARAMAKLSHPGIVGVHEFGEAAGGLLYIAMEYVEGTDVARMIASQKRLRTEHAMAITAHVCDALAYAHERGIIHRDIKPANIMVGYDGVVKVADFGLAKVHSVGGQTQGLTQSGVAMGTMHYMAPEALVSGISVDHRADIYAVGVMLYQMLTGKLPQGMFELPSMQVEGLDPRYDGIIAKALREDRNIRYQSAAEMRAELDSILTQPVVKVEAEATEAPAALPTQARPKRPAGQPYRPPQPAMQPQPTMKSSKGGLFWAVVGFVVLGIGAYLFLGRPQRISHSAGRDQTVAQSPPDRALAGAAAPNAAPAVAVPPPMVPAVTPVPPAKPAPLPEGTPLVAPTSKSLNWVIPFTKEIYESRAAAALRPKTADNYDVVQSDMDAGAMHWHFSDARLNEPGLKITSATLRFHTMNLPAARTESQISVVLKGKTIGTRRGARENMWIEIALDTGQIPGKEPSFDLVLQCGVNGVLVHNQKSRFPAQLVIVAERSTSVPPPSPAPSSLVLDQLPEFRTRIANYQKARHAQLSDLTTKYRAALVVAKDVAVKGGVLAEVTAADSAMAHASAFADVIEKNLNAKAVAPLPALTALSDPAPPRLKALGEIFEREAAKIDATLVTSLDQSLSTVQASLVKAENIEAAKAVEDFRRQVGAIFPKGVTTGAPANGSTSPTPAPKTTASAAMTLATATKDKPFVSSLGMKFVPVPITGGPTDGRRVLFSVWETRVQDFAVFAAEDRTIDSDWKNVSEAGVSQTPDHPVVNVSWDDAVKFCTWLGKKDRVACRLPSDHEWSCAAGIGSTEDPAQTPAAKGQATGLGYPWGKGKNPPKEFANYKGTHQDAFPFTAPVGSFPATPDGLHDLWGNVREWCADWHDPVTKTQRVMRGHGWDMFGTVRTVNRRMTLKSDDAMKAVGFRCVIEVPATRAVP